MGADVATLGGVALVVAAAGLIFLYTFTIGAGSPKRQVADLLGVKTWLVSPLLVLASAILMVIATSGSAAVLFACGALGAAIWSFLYPPRRKPRPTHEPRTRVAPPADASRGRRGLLLLIAVALEVAALILAS